MRHFTDLMSKSYAYSVVLRLQSEIQDVQFLQFLDKIINEKQISFLIDDLLLLEQIRQDLQPSPQFQNNLHRLVENGVVEVYSRGRGAKYILTKKYYSYTNQKGIYTRRKGLGTEEKKMLLIKHFQHFQKAKVDEFYDVISSLNREQIKYILKILKKENRVRYVGSNKRDGYWELIK